METCDKHDGCIVVYEDPGRYSPKPYCPFCKLKEAYEELEKDKELVQDKLDDSKAYADELAEELAKLNQPIPLAREPDGRHFRV